MFATHEGVNIVPTIAEAIEARIPSRVALATKLLAAHVNTPLHSMTVGNVMGGMRGLPCMLWEISGTAIAGDDKHSEITYHGKTLLELTSLLPKWPGSQQVSPEAMLWYLYTASVPTPAQFRTFAEDLIRRAERIPEDVKNVCDALPRTMVASAQLAACLVAYSAHSKFSAALRSKIPKKELWKCALEDTLDQASVAVMLSARIYVNKYHGGKGRDDPLDHDGDLAHNFALRIGNKDPVFIDLVRLCCAMHMDNGASVSAHVMRLGSSAWTDIYSSVTAGFISGTGPRHAGAIEMSIRYMRDMAAAIDGEGDRVEKGIVAYISDTLRKGRIVPGYGHAVVRGEDPRFTLVLKFLEGQASLNVHSQEGGGSKQFGRVNLITKSIAIIPEVLKRELPKMKNPAPNVDSLSGSLLCALGLEEEFAFVVMACSRGMGFGAQYVWDRVLGLPLERPVNLTMDQILARL